jgi:hypothetical protein
MDNEGHRAQRQREKHKAVEHIQNALAVIEALSREPDDWEKVHWAKAIGSLSMNTSGLLSPSHNAC